MVEYQYTIPISKGCLTMKKVLSVFMSMLLLFALCLPAFAAEAEAQVQTALDKETGVLTLTLSVPAGTDLATLETALHYDAEKLELSDVVYGAGDMTTVNKETAGVVRLYMIWAASQTDAATLATVTFKVKDGAAGKAAFEFKDTSATDSGNASLDFRFQNGAAFDAALTDAPPTDEKIPSTAGKYVAVGAAVAVVAAAAVTAGAIVKRKKQDA